ncbi:hypothetical protein OU5_P0030 (plasmid) [Pseudomonas mandelii JR-1]|uniref:Uncharacterized protein n=1 Tax=Pseudomonas mandelii JR-1 TaxID=1147786 RepID=A0A024EKH5_9PSED|nr:hypothetical protein OU5_P0030 [Pseudomonas mandelii JR-1]
MPGAPKKKGQHQLALFIVESEAQIRERISTAATAYRPVTVIVPSSKDLA